MNRYDEPATPFQLRYIAKMCVWKGVKEPVEEEVTRERGYKTFGEAGILIRQLEAYKPKNPSGEMFYPYIQKVCGLFPQEVKDESEEFSQRNCRAVLTRSIEAIVTYVHACEIGNLLTTYRLLGLESQTLSERFPEKQYEEGADNLMKLWDRLDEEVIKTLASECNCLIGKEEKAQEA